jgi:hypothetical protein
LEYAERAANDRPYKPHNRMGWRYTFASPLKQKGYLDFCRVGSDGIDSVYHFRSIGALRGNSGDFG